MIVLPSGARVWLACGHTDMRKGMDGLAMLAQQVLQENPFSGALFAFRGKRGALIKLLWFDGQGLCLFSNYLASYCSSFGWIRGLWFHCLADCRAVDDRVPSTAVLCWWVWPRRFVQISMGVVGVSGDETVRHPPGQCRLMDSELRGRLGLRQHSSVSQPVMARTESVMKREVGHSQLGKPRVSLATTRRTARTYPPFVQDVGDLGIDVIVEELVDEFDHLWLGLHLLCGGFWVQCGQRLGLASLEADLEGGLSGRRQFHERDVLDDVGEEPFALAVRQARITPKRFEICRHGDQTITDRVVDDTPVLPLPALPFFLCVGQGAQFVIPFAFERIRDETITWIDQHKSPLREIRFDPGTFNSAKTEPIGLLVSSLDLFSNLQSQFDRGGGHLGADQLTDGFVDGRTCNRLAVWFPARAVRTIADVPRLQPLAPRSISNSEISPATPAHGTSLQ